MVKQNYIQRQRSTVNFRLWEANQRKSIRSIRGITGNNQAPEFQKIMDQILHTTLSTFTFKDDILIVTKGTKEEHMTEVENVVKALDEAGFRVKLEKCQIANGNTELLCYKLSAEGIKPIEEKGPGHNR